MIYPLKGLKLVVVTVDRTKNPRQKNTKMPENYQQNTIKTGFHFTPSFEACFFQLTLRSGFGSVRTPSIPASFCFSPLKNQLNYKIKT